MARRLLSVGVAFVVTAGCLGQDGKFTLVPGNPFGGSPSVPSSANLKANPATEAVARRVIQVGTKVVKANPQIGLQPVFQTWGSPKPEIFHHLDTNSCTITITEGLVNGCNSDAQLAAVLSHELGKVVSERVARGGRVAQVQDDRTPPMEVRVGNDLGGSFGAGDATHLAELGKFEGQRRRSVPTALAPPPPDVLARGYLRNAGYTAADFDAVAPLLRAADGNNDVEKMQKLATRP